MSAAEDIEAFTQPLAKGGSVAVEDGAAVVRDARGAVVVRYDGDKAEIFVPAGDLVLRAPAGGVRIEARDDVVVEGARVVQRGAREASLESGEASLRLRGGAIAARGERVEARVREARLEAHDLTLLAGRIATTAEAVVQEVSRFELRAGRIVERARSTFREASELLQQRAGRVRTIVDGGLSMVTGFTSLRSREETSIDGKRILIG